MRGEEADVSSCETLDGCSSSPSNSISGDVHSRAQMSCRSTIEHCLLVAVIFQGAVRSQHCQSVLFKTSRSINCAITAKGMVL